MSASSSSMILPSCAARSSACSTAIPGITVVGTASDGLEGREARARTAARCHHHGRRNAEARRRLRRRRDHAGSADANRDGFHPHARRHRNRHPRPGSGRRGLRRQAFRFERRPRQRRRAPARSRRPRERGEASTPSSRPRFCTANRFDADSAEAPDGRSPECPQLARDRVFYGRPARAHGSRPALAGRPASGRHCRPAHARWVHQRSRPAARCTFASAPFPRLPKASPS